MTRTPTDDHKRVAATRKAESHPRRRRGFRGLLLLTVLVVAAYTAAQFLHLVPDWLDPFAERTKDRSSPVVLKSIRDLSRYEAATGEYQVVVDLEKDAKFLPSALRGQRTLFVGNGSVDAYVDFSKLAEDGLKIDKDRTTVSLRLPRAQLEPTNLDPERSYVFATQRGLINRFGDFFSSRPGDQQQLYVLAGKKIQTAASESGLRERADHNTKLMLENLLKALGFTKVTVTIADQP